ncbi:MAG: tyrosine-type recombinase/integrase [Candidatus Methanoperedens sp.]|nr:tyrosine-type recombinase/integrase [Candidatus Methanoperedens sp.]
MKIPTRNDTRKLPEDMLSEEEIEKMINACEHPRDRALVASLYESGARISELGNLKIKHVKFDQYEAVLMVDGKTGMRRVKIIFSSPYLATWLENHPFRQNPEAFVWVGIGTVGRNVPHRETGRHDGWKYKEGDFDSTLTIEQTLHIPVNRLAGSTWGTSPLQPLTRVLDLKGNIEVNLDHLVTRYLVPRYVYLLGRQGTSVPQELVPAFKLCHMASTPMSLIMHSAPL